MPPTKDPVRNDSAKKDSTTTGAETAAPTISLADVAKDRRTFDPAPSRSTTIDVVVTRSAPAAAGAIGLPVGEKGAVPRSLGLDRATLAAAGFEGKLGQTHVVPRQGAAALVAIGVGEGNLSTSQLRDAAAAFARAAGKHGSLATALHTSASGSAADAAAAVVEGIVLARYRYGALRNSSSTTPVSAIALLAGNDVAAVERGATKGRATAAAACLARDLANTPPSHLTATRIAELAVQIGAETGLGVEVFGPEELTLLGCGGLLGVNAGSAEPARLVKLTYRPKRAKPTAAHIALVGKGVMYDSGGISLKPSDGMHLVMKMDMSGAGNVLAVMSALTALGCPNHVSAYLMCTDNMPSGSAMKLGDVLHIHGGTTVEVLNTDAEGRLVLADGLALAAEESPDAIIDIATLTGACVVALGTSYAGVLGNDQGLVDAIRGAADATDEPVWQLPLAKDRYRKLLDSDVADLKNVGGPYGGAITAAVFLSEFVGDIPWAHLDIAGPMKFDADDSWRTKGASGVGTRLLIDLVTSYARSSA
ncbi:leucyl aminopeptidase [Desertimonas flava]|jgi:leucyl aminopeptidase|uniref:leucyl aminopeptidase n=1 Tax=Desertimonas flava TaxID=2064846 RepID=UPI000E353B59|nr:leucyl aminopeptidase [Desertimonas flava]